MVTHISTSCFWPRNETLGGQCVEKNSNFIQHPQRWQNIHKAAFEMKFSFLVTRRGCVPCPQTATFLSRKTHWLSGFWGSNGIVTIKKKHQINCWYRRHMRRKMYDSKSQMSAEFTIMSVYFGWKSGPGSWLVFICPPQRTASYAPWRMGKEKSIFGCHADSGWRATSTTQELVTAIPMQQRLCIITF